MSSSEGGVGVRATEAQLREEKDEAAGLLAKVLDERRRDADEYERTARFNHVVFWSLKLVTILLGAATAVAAKLWPSAVVVLGAGTSAFTFVDAFYPAGAIKTAYKHAALYLRGSKPANVPASVIATRLSQRPTFLGLEVPR